MIGTSFANIHFTHSKPTLAYGDVHWRLSEPKSYYRNLYCPVTVSLWLDQCGKSLLNTSTIV